MPMPTLPARLVQLGTQLYAVSIALGAGLLHPRGPFTSPFAMHQSPTSPPLTRWQSLGLHAFVLLPVLGALVALFNGTPMSAIFSFAIGVPLAVVFIGTPLLLALCCFLSLLPTAKLPVPCKKARTMGHRGGDQQ